MLYKIFNGDSNNEHTQTLHLMQMKAKNSEKQIWGINKVHNKDAE